MRAPKNSGIIIIAFVALAVGIKLYSDKNKSAAVSQGPAPSAPHIQQPLVNKNYKPPEKPNYQTVVRPRLPTKPVLTKEQKLQRSKATAMEVSMIKKIEERNFKMRSQKLDIAKVKTEIEWLQANMNGDFTNWMTRAQSLRSRILLNQVPANERGQYLIQVEELLHKRLAKHKRN